MKVELMKRKDRELFFNVTDVTKKQIEQMLITGMLHKENDRYLFVTDIDTLRFSTVIDPETKNAFLSAVPQDKSDGINLNAKIILETFVLIEDQKSVLRFLVRALHKATTTGNVVLEIPKTHVNSKIERDLSSHSDWFRIQRHDGLLFLDISPFIQKVSAAEK